MAMTAALYGISALATELDRDRRTIARALRSVKPDGKTNDGRHPAWRMTSALTALDRTEGRRRDAGGGVADDAVAALDFAGRNVIALLERLEAEPDIAKRREMLKAEGRLVGEYVRASDEVQARRSPDQQMIEGPFVSKLMASMVAETLKLCHITIEPDECRE